MTTPNRTTTTTLTARQAGVLNYLSKSNQKWPLVNDLKSRIPAGDDTLEMLAGNGFVRLRDPNESPTVRIGNAYAIALAVKGNRWVADDRLNLLFLAVVQAPGRRLRLNSIEARHFDYGLITDTVARGLLTLHYRGDGCETRFSADRYEFQHGGDFDLRPTNHVYTWTAL